MPEVTSYKSGMFCWADLMTTDAKAAKTRVARAGGGPTTLKLMSWFQYEPGRHQAWNKMMAKFNASQKDYKVVWTGWPANQYEDHVNTPRTGRS